MKKLTGYADDFKTIVTVTKAIASITDQGAYQPTIDSEKLDSGVQIRREVERANEQFSAWLKVLDEINAFSPPGIREFIKQTFVEIKSEKHRQPKNSRPAQKNKIVRIS